MKETNAVRCLLIDDREEEHEIFALGLRSTGLPAICHYYSFADEAFENLYHRAGPEPKVIFLDMNIPRMNGLEFLQKIKTIEHLKHIPVYIYSLGGFAETRKQAIDMGAAGYLIKPDSDKELVNMLLETLKLHMQGDGGHLES